MCCVKTLQVLTKAQTGRRQNARRIYNSSELKGVVTAHTYGVREVVASREINKLT